MDSRTTHRRSRSQVSRARPRVGLVAVGLVLVLGACSGGAAEVASPFTGSATQTSGIGGPDTVGSTQPTDGSDTSDPTGPGADPGSDPGSDPGAGTAPTVTAPEGVVTLSADGPWRLVESAPGVDAPGLVYELMPGLWAWLPVEEDLEAGIGWVLTEADVPVIEAYLQARLVYFRALNQNPMDLDSPDWERWYLDGGAAYLSVLRPRADRGEYGDLDLGVVLRPVVLGEERSETSALVVSCTLDGGVILTVDGELAEGSTWGVGESPDAFRMEMKGDGWRVTNYSAAEGVCAG